MHVSYTTEAGDDVSKDTIFGCVDRQKMLEWHREAYDIADEIKCKMEASKYSQETDSSWLHRATGKLSVCLMVMRWVDRRLSELGLELPATVDRYERETIRQLREEVSTLRRENRRLTLANEGENT